MEQFGYKRTLTRGKADPWESFLSHTEETMPKPERAEEARDPAGLHRHQPSTSKKSHGHDGPAGALQVPRSLNHRNTKDTPPSLEELGLSSTTLAAIRNSQGSTDKGLWERDGGLRNASDGEGSTMELYSQVISRHTPRPFHLHSPRIASPAISTSMTQAFGPQPPVATTPASSTAHRRVHYRPQSSIRKPLSNVNYSELTQRSVMKKNVLPGAAKLMRPVTAEEFGSMPAFLVSRLTLDQLNIAVEGINETLRSLRSAGLPENLGPDDFQQLGLGPKCQSVLGCLVRMDRVLLESSGGKTIYRVLP